MSDVEHQAQEDEQQAQEQAGQQGQSMKDKSGNVMDEAKKKMDRTGDGKFDAEDVKKMGEDAVNKVKGLFKKD